MFEAIAVVDTIEDYIEPVSALVDEARLHTTDEEVRIAAVDPANVAMVDTRLRASAFESYQASGETVGLNLDAFEDVLGLGDSDALLNIALDHQTRKLNLAVGAIEYTQALINPETIRSEPDIPALELPNTVTLTVDDLAHAVAAADLADHHMRIGVDATDTAVWFEAEGDTDTVTTTYHDDDLLDARIVEETRSLFSLDYLTDIVGAMPDDAEVQLRLGSEMPVKMRYGYSEGHATVECVVSPREGGAD